MQYGYLLVLFHTCNDVTKDSDRKGENAEQTWIVQPGWDAVPGHIKTEIARLNQTTQDLLDPLMIGYGGDFEWNCPGFEELAHIVYGQLSEGNHNLMCINP